ncbi:transporter substrate-binding domain-containing protein [Rhizobium sp. BR 314]|uniref:transporter substrate-binding domain-containing protein n=1 Tax=Rhizobium sp. BR 314 TaxID=3040013 RepID=UPI0039BF2AF3
MSVRKLLAITLVSALASLTEANAQSGLRHVKIATEGAYAPWNFTQSDGKLAGFEIDLAADLCRRTKLECEMVPQDWDGIIPALLAGKYDAIMSGMSRTPERLKAISFSRIYARPPNGFGVLKNSPLATLADSGKLFDATADEAAAEQAISGMKELLKGKTIGVQTSSTNSAFAQKYFKDLVDIREYRTTDEHDLDLVSGRVDLVFETVLNLASSRSKPGMEDVVQAGPAFVGGPLGDGVAVGLRKQDTDLSALFDSAIGAALGDGTVRTLSQKWFGMDVTPKE